jgi:sulfur-carrier protein adenylyltransferase/sulfurtransferase
MRHLSGLFLAALLITGVVVCGWAEEPAPSAFERMATAADDYFSAGIKDITAERLYAELTDADTTQPYVISVCQLADDSLRGHIPGAHHWDPASLIRNRDQLPANKKIVVYCYTGQLSSLCAAVLNLAGYDACTLRWGLCAWTADTAKIGMGGGWYHASVGHQPLETTPRPLTADYSFPTPQATEGEVVDLFCANTLPQVSKPSTEWKQKTADAVYANLEDGDPANNFFVVFCGPEDIYKAGHIPGAVNIPASTLGLDENLKHLPPHTPIVVYCLNGEHSIQVATLLNALGYDAYSLKRGLNTITDDANILGPYKWTPGTQNYPLLTGSLPTH